MVEVIVEYYGWNIAIRSISSCVSHLYPLHLWPILQPQVSCDGISFGTLVSMNNGLYSCIPWIRLIQWRWILVSYTWKWKYVLNDFLRVTQSTWSVKPHRNHRHSPPIFGYVVLRSNSGFRGDRADDWRRCSSVAMAVFDVFQELDVESDRLGFGNGSRSLLGDFWTG